KEWSAKQKKAYHRVLAGMRRHRGEKARFMTLTSADGMQSDIEKSFCLLRKRLFWVLPLHFVASGDLSYEYACKVYGEENLDVIWSFDYMKILTSEGVSGVFHVLYFGIWIPHNWLSSQWFDVTGSAFIVDVRETWKERDGSFHKIARYCIEQYTAGQDEFVSYYCSHGWIFKGAWRCYAELRDRYKDYTRVIGDMYGYPVYFVDKARLIPAWYSCIDRGGLLPETDQVVFDVKDGFQEFLASVKSARQDFGFNW
ncbi:MAG: hypothetical protein H7836_17670, partial [Magnetococcus sp. YQC-3]